MSRKFRAAEQQSNHREGLPTDRDIALYYRQSTEAQIGNISTTIQTVDMFASLQGMGWKEEQIKLIDIDAGVSGRLKIDEREGMSALFALIVDKKVGAVAAQDEDRFFRDDTMIQVDVFIDACKRSQVKVITPHFVYDFAHPMHGTFHARQFRFKCEMGAEFINTQVIGKLAGARKFLMKTGRWAGSSTPVGYMVDQREKVNHQLNANHRKLVPFEPFADVIKQYYELFVSYGGDLAQTHHHILKHKIVFPAAYTVPEGFRVQYRLILRDGYCFVSRPALRSILTNPVYIGHWMLNDVVVRWNNHEPIVSEALFWKAFNYLSPLNLDGTQNQNFRPVKQNSRPSLEDDRGTDRPLCSGLLYALIDGELHFISTSWHENRKVYNYHLALTDKITSLSSVSWNRRAPVIDEAVSQRLIERLKTTFSEESWQKMTEKLRGQKQDDQSHKRKQLQSLENNMQNVLASLQILSDPDALLYQQERLQQIKNEKARLIADIEAGQTQTIQYDELVYMREHFEELLTGWQYMTRDEKHLMLQKMIARIVLTGFVRRGSYQLTIVWRDGQEETFTLHNARFVTGS